MNNESIIAENDGLKHQIALIQEALIDAGLNIFAEFDRWTIMKDGTSIDVRFQQLAAENAALAITSKSHHTASMRAIRDNVELRRKNTDLRCENRELKNTNTLLRINPPNTAQGRVIRKITKALKELEL